MPVTDRKRIERMATLCDATFRKMMKKYGDSPPAMRDAGIAYAVDQIAGLVSQASATYLYDEQSAYREKDL